MNKSRILIVEDEAIVARDISQQLEELGYEPVGTCHRGDEAMEIAERLRPNLVLMDIQLEGSIDGIAAAQFIRDKLALPVVFLTAFAGSEMLDRAKKVGPFGYIIKPFDERELRTGVEMALYKHESEIRLRQSEERYRLLFENNPLAMWLYDVETRRFLAVNESAVRQYGYSSGEFLGLTISEILPPDEHPAPPPLPAADGTATQRSVECRHRRKDGTIIHVETNSRALAFNGRDVQLVLANDITEKKLLEEKFLHAQRLESVGMLAAGIAHDLNNVLAPIVFAAPMLRDSLSEPRDLKILDVLEQSANRGAGLVKQILGFAHTTAGELRPTQVRHLVRDIISVIDETFPKSVQLEHGMPADLWMVHGNATQIHQVLVNLCINARDAMPQGGTLRIGAANRRLDAEEARTLPGARPGTWIVIEITDTGTGIAPELLDRIWDPFFTTKSADQGTGLGLSTVRGIVVNHHGFISLNSIPGHGTTFRVFLPAVADNPTIPTHIPAIHIPRGRGELILVVDDNDAVRDTVAAILRQHGYQVLSSGDGEEAIRHFTARAGEVALVVTDVDMPILGGAALARSLLQVRPEIPLVIMSGLSRNEPSGADVQSARDLAQAFLAKPFQAEDLLGTVHRLLHPPEKT